MAALTKKGHFKKVVRARMARTGEPYTLARARLLGRPPAAHSRGGQGMYPFERFTERAKRVLQFAQEEATTSQHSYIGTEHLLLGLLRERECLAAKVLANFGVDEEPVRQSILAVLGRNEGVVVAQIIPTSRVKKVLDISFEQARAYGHNYVGTEHLLLGLLIEGGGIAAHVLGDVGVTEAKARAEIEVLLKTGGQVGLVKLGDEVREALDRARQLAREAGTDTVQIEHLRKALRKEAG